MNYVEKKEAALKKQIIEQTKEPDFEGFWQQEIENLRAVPLRFERKPLVLPYKTFDTYEITYNTHDETVVTAYFYVPKHTEGKLPCAAVFHGGGGNGPLTAIALEVVSTGICAFCIDVRSQGGKTYDRAKYDVFDDYRGSLMTHGVLDKNNFYMRNIYLDAVRAVDVISELPEVDADKIVAYGASQGGALSIVTGAFSGKVKKVYAAVPSYNCLEARVDAGSGVFGATKNFLTLYPEHTDAVMETLSYFDINNIASLLTVPSLVQIGLSDPTCIPGFVYSVFSHISGEKELMIEPFTPHVISKEYKLRVYKEFGEL